ncbi:sporulation protein YqfD [Paenibacillus xanthanilyticus]|uniref:Sporulation protein YqfD n=1 Tax=Paenibacillus xanthanilyticus TaxID=1783531 RepID=A0ABV8KD36_9BACL
MNASWLQWVRGIVTIRVRGEGLELLVNRALAKGLQLWSISRTSGGELVCQVAVGDFFKLRPLLKETGCRVHVAGRKGMPFWLRRVEKRLFFGAGLVLFFVGMYLLSSLIWSIDVKGNEKLSEEHILKVAKQQGLYPFQWSFRLPDTSDLQRDLTRSLPGAAWVGVEKRGTKITIQIVETTKPAPSPPVDPRHIIAAADAVITDIQAETGRPVVNRNQKVKRGDILISGILGDENHNMLVPAHGKVRGLVWHEYDIASPLTRKVQVYTGEVMTRWYGVAFGRALKVSGYGKIPYQYFETIRHEEQAAYRTWSLPLGRIKETIREVRLDKIPVPAAEAKTIGLNQARADILSKAGADAVVRAENILHEKTENGKVYMKVLFEVEQSIAAEQPLVQMQGE